MQGLSGLTLRQHPNRPIHGANVRHLSGAAASQLPHTRLVPRSAASGGRELATPQPSNMLLVKFVELLFSIKPVFARASAAARQKIVDRSQMIGQDFEGEVRQLRSEADWNARLAEATNPAVTLPAYYTQPFHAYENGNLCWEAAMEFEVASRSVHSQVLDPEGKQCDPEGDDKFRAAFMDITKRFMMEAGARDVSYAVDFGCATGLSTAHVCRAFPGAQVTGLDLSPHMVAVGRHQQQQRQGQLAGAKPLQFLHANAEATGLLDESADLVTLCLVAHELPADATAAIFREAYRLLRPGGSLAVMEMNPASPIWRRIFGNPAAYVAFKATEPWLLEYMELDMEGALTAAGFASPQTESNSPRHKTVVAVKPH